MSASGTLAGTHERRATCRAGAASSRESTSAANLPDFEAHGGGKVLDPTYSVRFTSSELWGEGGARDDVVHVDLWERYLEGIE